MPTYDYACPDCGGFDAFLSLAARNEPAVCPVCGTASQRVFVSHQARHHRDRGQPRQALPQQAALDDQPLKPPAFRAGW